MEAKKWEIDVASPYHCISSLNMVASYCMHRYILTIVDDLVVLIISGIMVAQVLDCLYNNL
jgi:hypothetical protein